MGNGFARRSLIFGGKRALAPALWRAFGDASHYVEPFCGSLATLLARPAFDPERHVETVNDADGLLVNAWRGIRSDPAAVAHYADWPVSELDLFARHVWLVERMAGLAERLMADPDYADPKAAGWWLWGAAGWIGDGWCDGRGPWAVRDGKVINVRSKGQGVQRKLPHLSDAGHGVQRQLPHLGNAGHGVQRRLPHLGNAGRGLTRKQQLIAYFEALSDRLERVRITCGDFARVLTDSTLFPNRSHGRPITAVLLDPPYGDGSMEYSAGGNGDPATWTRARAWALAHGDDTRLRIALCGYDDVSMPDSWRRHSWTPPKGLQTAANDERHRETVWFSPGCIDPANSYAGTLFEGL